MTNKEIYETIKDAIEPIYEIYCVDIEDSYKQDRLIKHVYIRVVGEDEVNQNRILSSFDLPEEIDEEIVTKFANASLDIQELKEYYNNK